MSVILNALISASLLFVFATVIVGGLMLCAIYYIATGALLYSLLSAALVIVSALILAQVVLFHYRNSSLSKTQSKAFQSYALIGIVVMIYIGAFLVA